MPWLAPKNAGLFLDIYLHRACFLLKYLWFEPYKSNLLAGRWLDEKEEKI